MSVINKMLQDLDARQGSAADASQMYTKPESIGERRISTMFLAGAALGVALIAAGGAFAWRYWQKAHQPLAAPVQARVVIIPAPPKPVPQPAAPVTVVEVAEPPGVAPAPAVEPAPVREAPVVATPHARKPDNAAEIRPRAPKAAAAGQMAKPLAQEEPAAQGKEVTTEQKAEAAYRRGLASIQEGYLNDGIGSLEQALQANPRHDAARQTLVRTLIDNKRTDEAIAYLQTGLSLDSRQPWMAMLLARLQIEHGGTGIDTLMRTLPYVGSNSEYHGFLAGALQRQQRHREAAEQYQLALRGNMQNGVWLMGLGMSLQAERRDAEALDAFHKAKDSGSLSAELQAFVDGKIRQLTH